MTRSAEQVHNGLSGQDSILSSRHKPCPVPHMLFRPEEVDPVSSVRPILGPPAERNVNVTTDSRRLLSLNDPIFYDDPHGITTIQAWGVYLNCLPWEHPADRQGFEPSLPKPLLPAIHGDCVLVREIVKGRKGYDQVSAGV